MEQQSHRATRFRIFIKKKKKKTVYVGNAQGSGLQYYIIALSFFFRYNTRRS